MWPKPHSHEQHVRPFQMPVYIYHTEDCLRALVQIGVLLNDSDLLENFVNILRWFLLWLSNSPALFAEGFLRKPLSCLCSQTDCQHSSCFPLVHCLISPVATFADIQSTGSGPMCGCEQPCLIY